jgi:uncharacterized protein YabN with tetrapyrrole methylase and pyrophosphatase domain
MSSKEGELILQVLFHRTLGTGEYQHKTIVFHVNDNTEQAIEKILRKTKVERGTDDFALYYFDKTTVSRKPMFGSKKGKGSAVSSWARMPDGSNLSTFGLISKVRHHLLICCLYDKLTHSTSLLLILIGQDRDETQKRHLFPIS